MISENIKYTTEDLKDHDGTAAVIVDDTGSILMQEHVKYGFWTIPVGKAKSGQSVVEGLKEEVLEETNLRVSDCKEINVKVDEYLRNGVKVKVTAHIFEVTSFTGELKNLEPKKHNIQIFMTIDEILKLPYLSDVTLRYLKIRGFNRPQKI